MAVKTVVHFYINFSLFVKIIFKKSDNEILWLIKRLTTGNAIFSLSVWYDGGSYYRYYRWVSSLFEEKKRAVHLRCLSSMFSHWTFKCDTGRNIYTLNHKSGRFLTKSPTYCTIHFLNESCANKSCWATSLESKNSLLFVPFEVFQGQNV